MENIILDIFFNKCEKLWHESFKNEYIKLSKILLVEKKKTIHNYFSDVITRLCVGKRDLWEKEMGWKERERRTMTWRSMMKVRVSPTRVLLLEFLKCICVYVYVKCF